MALYFVEYLDFCEINRLKKYIVTKEDLYLYISASISSACSASYLWKEVSTQCCVFAGHSEAIEGHNVAHPLYLMDHSISVGHVGSVCHGGLPWVANHSVNLSLDLLCIGAKSEMNYLSK